MILGGQLHFNTFVGRVDKNNIKDIKRSAMPQKYVQMLRRIWHVGLHATNLQDFQHRSLLVSLR